MRGLVVEKGLDLLTLEVAGIGYALEVPISTSDVLVKGSEVLLFLHHSVREDSERLFAFATQDERRLFRLLQKVNGVGPSVALNILSRANVEEIAQAIAEERIDILKSLKGIGPKTAQRLVTELRDQVQGLGTSGEPTGTGSSPASSLMEDAVQALLVLGCQPKQAKDAARAAIEAQPKASLEDVVRQALRLAWPR